jgi:hypothetical protein
MTSVNIDRTGLFVGMYKILDLNIKYELLADLVQ